MFENCYSLTQLDISGWDTSNVTNMYYLFNDCSSLTQLDLSNWNVGNVTSMSSMFSSCKSLQSVGDLSGWDTSNVTDMKYMFYDCSSLTQLDVSNWNVGNVTRMINMFNSCESLTQLDVYGWDTSNVTNMGYIFFNCSSLTQIDLSNWNVGNVTNFDRFAIKSGIINFVGGRTIDEVIEDNISILNGVKVSISSETFDTNTDRASLRALINGLADLTGQSSKILRLKYSLEQKLTNEDIAVATAKNWTIANNIG